MTQKKKKHPGGRPPLYDSVEELDSVIQAYFADCDSKEIPYGVEGLALALGMNRRTLLNYEDRAEFIPSIKRAKQKVRACVETLMLQGKLGSGAIFWLKANAKWEDGAQKDDDSLPPPTRVEIVVQDARKG